MPESNTKSKPNLNLDPAKLLFSGRGTPGRKLKWPAPPPWRRFDAVSQRARGAKHQVGDEEIKAVNTALYLRRPLLITGKPGTGKTGLAYAVAHEFGIEPVYVWPITSRSTLLQGLYHYDAVGRLQDSSLAGKGNAGRSKKAPDIGKYIRLGPLGAALACSQPNRPTLLLIDEIDKSDIDLPNDLLHIFEEGRFEIPELKRLRGSQGSVIVGLPESDHTVESHRGGVTCREFPIVFLTSNGERDFPPAFLRRCLRLEIDVPNAQQLAEIVQKRLNINIAEHEGLKNLLNAFVDERDQKNHELATDQLLNAVLLIKNGLLPPDHPAIGEYVLRDLSDSSS